MVYTVFLHRITQRIGLEICGEKLGFYFLARICYKALLGIINCAAEMTDDFIKLDSLEVQNLLEDINPKIDGFDFNPETTTILAQDLNFFPGHRLLEINDVSEKPDMQRIVIHGTQGTVVMDWTNEPIYGLCEKVPIRLGDDTVADYVKFFFHYVRGRHGRFIIIESVDDIAWSEEPPPPARNAIGKMIEPIAIENRDDEQTYNLVARMIFKDSLFKSKVHVQKNGLVSLSGEELVVEEMPVLEDGIGSS